jgi:hypothetical protein
MPRLSPKALAGRKLLEELQKESKRCTKGKSCGASCVNPQKYCVVSAPKKISQSLSRVRDKIRTVNYNWTECAVAAVLSGEKIETKKDLEEAIKRMNVSDKELWISNLYGGSTGQNPWKDKEFKEYISNLKESLAPFAGRVEKVVVAGSTRNLPEVKELDKSLNKKQIKSDVIAWVKGEGPVGISVKDSPGAPLTNFAIEGGKGSSLQTLRRKLLENAGFDKNWRKRVANEEEKKEMRKKMNSLFYDEKGPYWQGVRKHVEDNEKEILKELIKGMTAEGVPFPVYEVNGKAMKNLDSLNKVLNDPKNDVRLKVIPNPAKNPSPSAALHLGLFINGEKQYDGKIRFKGNLFSPPELLLKNKGYS